jgi:hypothetical protein
MAGQDLPDDQVIIEDYIWEVQPNLTHTSFMVRGKHREQQAMSFHFEVKVAGG